jgi:hypothetical protein
VSGAFTAVTEIPSGVYDAVWSDYEIQTVSLPVFTITSDIGVRGSMDCTVTVGDDGAIAVEFQS